MKKLGKIAVSMLCAVVLLALLIGFIMFLNWICKTSIIIAIAVGLTSILGTVAIFAHEIYSLIKD